MTESTPQTKVIHRQGVLAPMLLTAFALVSTWQSGIMNDYIPESFKDLKRQTINVVDEVTFLNNFSNYVGALPNVEFTKSTKDGLESLVITTGYVYGSEKEALVVKDQLLVLFAMIQGRYGLAEPLALTSEKQKRLYLADARTDAKDGKYMTALTIMYKSN